MNRTFIGLGSICAFLAVAFGAFGAHALKPVLTPDMLAIYETGVTYQMTHALGLLAVGIAAMGLQNGKLFRASGWFLFAGIVIFSGSLYLLSLSGIKVLGAITPIGGVCFLIGWVLFAMAAWKHRAQ